MKTLQLSAIALTAIGLAFCSDASAAEPVKAGKPVEFPEKILKAWKAAGAEPGWMRKKEAGHTGFLIDIERVAADELPAFEMHKVKPGALAALPDPGIPFGLRFNFSDITDDGIKELVGLKSLTVLNLSSTKVTGAAFKSVAELPNLEALYLAYNNERITGAGLGELAKLKKLRQLDLGVTETNNAGMKELAKLEGLTRLSLYYTKISDAGMAELAGLKGLVWLNMDRAPVGDAAMKIVGQNKDLQTLNLFQVKITDAGVKELAGLQKLEKLTLSHSKLTDACVKDLAGMKGLRTLELSSTGVTYAGVKEHSEAFQGLKLLGVNFAKPSGVSIEELKRALPKCTVNY